MDEKEGGPRLQQPRPRTWKETSRFVPVYPFWAMLIIAVEVLVIGSLLAPGRVLAGA